MRVFSGVAVGWVILLGCVSPSLPGQAKQGAVKLEFRRAETKPSEGLTEAAVEGTKEKVYLHKTPEVTNDDVEDAILDMDADGRPIVAIRFSKAVAPKLVKLSEEHKGKPLAILIDGKIISAPVLITRITDGQVRIAGLASKEEAQRIVKGLKAK